MTPFTPRLKAMEEEEMGSSNAILGPTPESADTEAAPTAYKRLSDVPADELASRLVTTLIMQKGNLNQYDQVLKQFINNTRAEAAEDCADLLAALTDLVREANRLGPQLPYNAPTAHLAKAIERAQTAIGHAELGR